MIARGILVITGASGSGKTAVLRALAAAPPPHVTLYHFDSVGIPATAAMTARFGSPEAWQAARTHEWITRLAGSAGRDGLAVLEGQVRPGIVADACRASRVRHAWQLLLDCRPEVRAQRLMTLRDQPELASAQMMSWAAYLRGQADALHIPTLDTSDVTLEEVTRQVRDHITGLLQLLESTTPAPEPL